MPSGTRMSNSPTADRDRPTVAMLSPSTRMLLLERTREGVTIVPPLMEKLVGMRLIWQCPARNNVRSQTTLPFRRGHAPQHAPRDGVP